MSQLIHATFDGNPQPGDVYETACLDLSTIHGWVLRNGVILDKGTHENVAVTQFVRRIPEVKS
jgi:hypothetical protein